MTSNDYKWYEYCPKCRVPEYIGELPNGPWKRCEGCGELLNYCSKDVLDELK